MCRAKCRCSWHKQGIPTPDKKPVVSTARVTQPGRRRPRPAHPGGGGKCSRTEHRRLVPAVPGAASAGDHHICQQDFILTIDPSLWSALVFCPGTEGRLSRRKDREREVEMGGERAALWTQGREPAKERDMLQHPARRNDGLGESGAGGDSQLHSVVTLSAFLPVWCSLARVCRFKAGFVCPFPRARC